jgi:hypothetical protein
VSNDAELIRLEKALAKVGARRKKVRAELDAVVEEAKPLVIALYRAGYANTEIARIGGYNVRAIHDILRKAGIGPQRRRRLTQE